MGLLFILLLLGLTQAEKVGVELKKGFIRGLRLDLDQGRYYYAFRGIKYAKPPVKQLRFQDPVDIEPWGVMDAFEDGHLCPQFDISRGDAIGDEDCLNMNVYTPGLDSKKRAVMVYFHGGAYIMGGGSSFMLDPAYLLEQDVVIVTFNYRLGPLGFFVSEEGSNSGNQALKDQLLVLNWVKENIVKFGGNPDKITIFGEDSGAAAVTIMAMSPLANGLFHGAIALSGTALCDQYLQSKPTDVSKDLASRLECPTSPTEEMIDCLQKLTQQEIIKATQNMFKFWSFPRHFAPYVDGVILPDSPENLLVSGRFAKVPFIVGQTKDEGAFFYRLTLNAFNNGLYDDNFLDNKVPRILPYISDFNTKLYPITRQVRKRYFTNVDMENEDEFRPKYVDFLTDLLYTRCTDRFARILANHSVPTYEYSFEYRGQYSIVNLQGEQVDMGVAHGDDLQYVFKGIWGDELEMSSSDTKFSRNVFLPLLTNFAKTSIPIPSMTENFPVSWPPTSPSSTNVLRIDSKLRIETDYLVDRLRFWSETIPKLFSGSSKKNKKDKEEL